MTHRGLGHIYRSLHDSRKASAVYFMARLGVVFTNTLGEQFIREWMTIGLRVLQRLLEHARHGMVLESGFALGAFPDKSSTKRHAIGVSNRQHYAPPNLRRRHLAGEIHLLPVVPRNEQRLL